MENKKKLLNFQAKTLQIMQCHCFNDPIKKEKLNKKKMGRVLSTVSALLQESQLFEN